jgi:DNA-binding response OmpR family regulator
VAILENGEKNKKIFIAEDEPVLLQSLLFTLKRFHFHVTGFPDGIQVLDQLMEPKCGKCDLLITDIQLPGLSGLEVIDKLRLAQLQLPVIVMTAYGDQKVLSEIQKRNIDGYLTKPFSMNDLVKRVVQFLS